MVPADELEGYKRRLSRPVLALVVVALIIVVVSLSLPARRQSVPEFDLPLLSGSGRLSSDELKGSPVVLNFWASWCVPCRKEARLLERAWLRYRGEGVRFVGVNVQDSPGDARRFVDEHALTFPIVVDAKRTLERRLEVFGLPQTFFVGRDWQLSSSTDADAVGSNSGVTVLGAMSARELREGIEAALQGDE